MKKTIIFLSIAAMFLFGGCASKTNVSSTAVSSAKSESAKSVQSNEGGSSEVSTVSSTASLTESRIGTLYVQEAEGANVEITLLPDGTFTFRAVMYDGLPVISGTYTESGDKYFLTPKETNAQNLKIEELGAIVLTKNGDELTYQGAQIGETQEGDIFKKA